MLVLNGDTGASMIQDGTVTSAKIVDGQVAYADMVGTDIPMVGIGQTWQDVTASRALGTTYTNTTGKPIEVHVSTSSGANADSYFYINGNIFARALSSSSAVASHYMIVPNGASYSIVSASGSISRWSELR